MSIKVFDTKLVSEDMFAQVVHLPYFYTRVDVPPTESQPELDLAGMYWTHQFYNYCPIDDPKEYDSPGLEQQHSTYIIRQPKQQPASSI